MTIQFKKLGRSIYGFVQKRYFLIVFLFLSLFYYMFNVLNISHNQIIADCSSRQIELYELQSESRDLRIFNKLSQLSQNVIVNGINKKDKLHSIQNEINLTNKELFKLEGQFRKSIKTNKNLCSDSKIVQNRIKRVLTFISLLLGLVALGVGLDRKGKSNV